MRLSRATLEWLVLTLVIFATEFLLGLAVRAGAATADALTAVVREPCGCDECADPS